MKQTILSAVVLCFLITSLAPGQTANATLGGSVSDTSGALIPGVKITATNTETGIVNTTLSNEAGVYQLPSLQPGTYTSARSCPAFRLK